MVAVLGVEGGVLHEVDTAPDDVARGEGGPVGLAGARGAEGVAVVPVVAVAVLVPAGEAVHVDALRGKADAHVAVAA